MFSSVVLSHVCLLFTWQVYRILFSMNSLENISVFVFQIEKYLDIYVFCKEHLGSNRMTFISFYSYFSLFFSSSI